MDFYLDENLPNRLAHALNELEGRDRIHNVYSTKDRFGAGIKDPELIVKLKEASGIFITQDLRMLTRENEYTLLIEKGVTVFFIKMTSGADFWKQTLTIMNNWETIKLVCSKKGHPFLCLIKNNGTYEYK